MGLPILAGHANLITLFIYRRLPMAVTPEDFALEDFKQKISYLTAHFTRMWTPFNYFVAIETALVGGRFLMPNNVSSRALAIAGVLISAVYRQVQDRLSLKEEERYETTRT